MLAFAVEAKGDKARWVLDTDPVGERLLLADTEGALQWHPMADCKFIRAHTPDQPTQVLPFPQQVQQPQIVRSDEMPNRMARRGNGAG